jgi:hypothetical protein
LFKAKVTLESNDGKTWTVVKRFYVTSDVNPRTKKGYPFGRNEFVEEEDAPLTEGDALSLTGH